MNIEYIYIYEYFNIYVRNNVEFQYTIAQIVTM